MTTKRNDGEPKAVVEFPQTQAAKNKLRNKAEVGDKIRAYRAMRNLSQPQLAEALGVTKNAITNWENGTSRPDFALIAKLCLALDISADAFFGLPSKADALSQPEWEHMKLYRAMTNAQRKSVDTLMEALIENDLIAFREECRKNFSRVYRTPLTASAGTGSFLGDTYEREPVFLHNSRSVCRADLIITVSGDSMNPTFHDGDDLLVEYTESLQPGEIGIFVVAGDGFVKEYQPDGLHSHNPKYKTIHPAPDDNFRCVGRVLDVVTQDMLANPRERDVLSEIYSSRRKK